MNVPVPIRLSSIEAWQRFADAGGFDALTESGAPVSQIPFGGVGNWVRLQRAQAARLRAAYPAPRRYRIDDERTQDIVQRLEAGETLEQAAKPWRITRERARQIAERYFSLNETSLGEIRQAQKEKKQAEEAFEQLVQAPLCAVCNEPVLRTISKRTCSPECGEEYNRHMWRYNEKRRQSSRLGNARYALAHPEGLTESALAYARRVVADPTMPFNRRFTMTNRDDVCRAVDAVRQLLTDAPRSRTDVADELQRQGIQATEAILNRVRREVGVVSKRRGFGPGGVVLWALPDSEEVAS